MWEIFSNGDKPCSGLTKSEMMRVSFYIFSKEIFFFKFISNLDVAFPLRLDASSAAQVFGRNLPHFARYLVARSSSKTERTYSDA